MSSPPDTSRTLSTEEFYRQILDSIEDGVYFVDRDRKITFWNRGAERMTGWRREEVLGRWCGDGLLCHCTDTGSILCGDGCPLAASMTDGQSRETEVFMLQRKGSRLPVRVRASPIRNDSGEIVGCVETFTDNQAKIAIIDELKELKQQSLLDVLTGIGNRRFVESRFGPLCQEMKALSWTYAILFIDIDHFKRVNDTYGHDVGDLVLRALAETLSASMRPLDVLGRWGGEEFVIVAPNLAGEALLAVAERFRALISRCEIPIASERVSITASIGATVALASESWQETIARADRLMYESKAGGRNRVTIG